MVEESRVLIRHLSKGRHLEPKFLLDVPKEKKSEGGVT